MRRISLSWLPVIALLVSMNLLSCSNSGGGGSSAKLLDTSFGAGGKVTSAIGTMDDEIFAMAIQTDGKLAAAGYTDTGSQIEFALVRYNTDGTLDTSFGIGGIVTLDIGNINDGAFALAIQPSDQKLVVAGRSFDGSQNVFALVRYNTNGTLDTTFNPSGTVPGIVTTTIGGDDAAQAIAIQPSDGKLVVAGYSYDSGLGQYVFALARYNTDGSLDTAGFNPAGTIPGIVTTPIGTIDDTAFAVAIQPSDGKIVAAGYTDTGSQFEFALVRYNMNGSLDTVGFNPAGTIPGVVTSTIGGDDAAFALAIQPSDERLVAAGYSLNNTTGGYEFALVRYNTNGSLDTAFNPTGTLPGAVTTAIGTIDDEAFGLVIQSNGKLVAGGYSDNGTQFVFALVSYNPDGTLDTTFNSTGKLTTTVGSNDAAQALIIQPDDQLVAAGYSLQGGQYEFAVVRYLPLP